jgi:hypothetical protein
MPRLGHRSSLSNGDARGYELRLKSEGRRVALRLIDSIDRLEEQFESDLGSKEVERVIGQLGKTVDSYKKRRTSGRL